MIHDRRSVNCIELAIRRVSDRMKADRRDTGIVLALDEIADEIARIASGKDERFPRENTDV